MRLLLLVLAGALLSTVHVVNCAIPEAFGTAVSSAKLGHEEQTVFTHTVKGTNGAAVNHWWLTGSPTVDNAIVRFYIDNDPSYTVELVLDLSVGIGFDDDSSPWGTQFIGKGARSGGVFNNIRIPFTTSLRVTVQQAASDKEATFWFIIRGAENLPINVEGFKVPPKAHLKVYKINGTYAPLEKINLVESKSAGLLFAVMLSVQSQNLNFLEGCVRAYIDGGSKMLLSSGTEDYFDSAFYFNAGKFHLPVSGLTHIDPTKGKTQVSAYRFHYEDPLVWNSNFTFVWRNGDTIASNGQKCIDDNGTKAGNPTTSQVFSYAYVYEWS